ncbi:MAG: sugar phosphate nucleotidyltransferase [Varibaculum sp.]|nr:sugar phosphate nucleotidyltransferase [Varibaculum sp.]
MSAVKKAVILARGLGTRMRKANEQADSGLSAEQSAAASKGLKGLIEIAGHPFLDYGISALADAGVTDVCLVIGPEQDMFREYYDAPGRTSRVRIHYAIQEEPLGTANAVVAAKEFAGSDRFYCLNSDNYYRVAGLRELGKVSGAGALGYTREAIENQSNIPTDRIPAMAILMVEDGLFVDVVEKPEPEVIAAHPDAPLSMNCWLFGPEIFPACENVALSSRGEYELPQAVSDMVAAGTPVQVVCANLGILDMSNRGDIAFVEKSLEGIEVTL